jgi:hypothetical protein
MDRTPRAALLCGLALIAGLTLSGCGLGSASSSASGGSSGTTAASGQDSAGQSIGN